ncbi:hypothetical protein [Brevundimonas sp.]|uniref:hypothetical protein n=1 Tax=Brevundimonas sp. TaxID=1871086 RepID=UPI002E13E1C5|nr:hypothetical protein [Brevundimonas sp.]
MSAYIELQQVAAEEGAVAISSEASKAKDDLKRMLIGKQQELFPHMRRTYAAHLSGAVAGLQANFPAVGAGGKTLRRLPPASRLEKSLWKLTTRSRAKPTGSGSAGRSMFTP